MHEISVPLHEISVHLNEILVPLHEISVPLHEIHVPLHEILGINTTVHVTGKRTVVSSEDKTCPTSHDAQHTYAVYWVKKWAKFDATLGK